MLPNSVMDYLKDAARKARTTVPDRNTSLFEAGVLDSFGLVDFVSVIEQECAIRVPDSALKPGNFDTIAKVEAFIAQAREQ